METDPDNYDVNYTLFYGTDEDELTEAGTIFTAPNTKRPVPLLIATIILLTFLLYLLSRQVTPKVKTILQTACVTVLFYLLDS